MDFRVLGPLEIEDGSGLLPLGSAKQRALLAILLLHPNQVVSRDRLVDDLWGEQPPTSAQHSLEVYVSRLRKTLHANGADGLLVTRPGGYALRFDPDQLDAARFERFVEEGRRALAAANYGLARERLVDALALWRGPPLGDLAYEPFARREGERLEEQRIAALEDRYEAELALGLHAALVGELETLINENPLRERLHGHLMLALYRSGRQAEALDVYRELRGHLSDELGLEPSPPLQRLEQAILRQDPVLELAATKARPGPAAPEAPTRRLIPDWWRPMAIAVVIAGLLVAVIAGALALFTGNSEPSLRGIDANAVGIVDPGSGHITGEVLLKGTPSDVTTGAGSIWTVSPNRQTVTRINSRTGSVAQSIPVGHGPSGIAYAGRSVWVANSLDGTVSRIAPATNEAVDRIPVGNVPIAITAGFGSVWITTAGDRSVVRLDARSGRKLATISTGDVGRGITVGDGAVWVSDDERGRVSRLDPNTYEQINIPVGDGAGAVAYVAGKLWVANEFAGTIAGVDPQTNVVARTLTVGGAPNDLVAANGELWVVDASRGTISRVDLQRNEVARTIKTGNRPQGVAFAAGRLWLPVQPAANQHRGGTLRVTSVSRTFDSLDPALGYDGAAWNVLGMLYSGLTAFQRVGNADGTKLVPDLATSLPKPSDDSRTYVFQLRRGIRYSDGRPVRPADFRYGLERLFALHPSPENQITFYDHIRGAQHCLRRPKHCDLSAGIVTDERANTVTFHLVDPDPELLEKLTFAFASPVPADTPRHEAIVPATGPYDIASYKVNPKSSRYERRLVLAPNPYFREWSKAATPDGYPHRIAWTFLPAGAASYRDEVRAVEGGHSDVAFDGVPRGLLHEVRTQYANQVHAHPLWGVTYLFLNSRRPPFNDVRVRRAVNFAVDRAAAVSAGGQALGAEPTCQILPPNFPGFHRYCPYTLQPRRSAFWNEPDLKQARRLVTASGTKGAVLKVWIPGPEESLGPIAAATLRAIGFRPYITHVGPFVWCCSPRGMANPRSRVQAGVGSWFADYPAASSFMDFFACSGFAHVCDRRIAAGIRQALSVQAFDPEAANQYWARIDHAMVDRAVAVPLITHITLDFVSQRVGNYESIPYPNGVLLDQLWVR